MATRKEQEVLQADLRKWFNLLGYRVTDVELKVITKSSRNIEFWRLVPRLILPVEEIEHVRSQLAAFQRKQDYNKISQEVTSLQQRKQELLAKIAASKSSQTLSNIKSLKLKQAAGENSKNACLEDLSDKTMKSILQKSLIKHCKEVQSKFSEAGNSLNSITARKANLPDDKSYLLVGGSEGSLETDCSKSFRQILRQVKSYLESHINNTDGTVSKTQLWESTASIHARFSPQEILNTMKSIAAEDSRVLIEQTNCHNIEKDLESLDLNVVNGNIVSRSGSVDLEKELEVHAVTLQNKATKVWTETLKCRNTVRELSSTSDLLQSEIKRATQNLPWSSEEKLALSALLKFKLREQELLSKKDQLGTELQGLRDEKDRLTKEKIGTLKTHQTIMGFKKNQEKKQSVIKSLVGQTNSLDVAITSQKESVQGYVNTKLLPASLAIGSKLQSVRSYPGALTDTIISIPLDRLHYSQDEVVPVRDLSIYQFTNPSYQKLLTNSGLPPHLESQSLIKALSEILVSAPRHNMISCLNRNVEECHREEVPCSTDVFETLRGALQDFDTFTSEHILGKIKRYEEKVDAATKKCPSIRNMIKVYAEQPAQYLTPWIEVEGMTMTQLHEKWLVKSTL